MSIKLLSSNDSGTQALDNSTSYRGNYHPWIVVSLMTLVLCLCQRADAQSEWADLLASYGPLDSATEEVSPDIVPHDTESKISLLDVVYQTIAINPELRIQKQSVQYATGVRQEQRGRFDVYSTTSIRAQQNYEDLSRAEDSGFGSGLTKQLRDGRQIGIQANATRLSDAFDNIQVPNTGTVRIFVDQPLLRRRGIGTQANELASQAALNAERYQLRRAIADRVLATTKVYWDYVAAYERLQVALARQARTQGRLEEIRTLIEKAEQPRSALGLAEADLADVTAELLNIEANLHNVRQSLGIAIGISYLEIGDLPAPSDQLSVVCGSLKVPPMPSMLDFETAFAKRGELLAANEQLEAALVQWQASKQNAKPDLSVRMNLGYSNVQNGSGFSNFFQPFFGSPPGANAGMAISYDAPRGNNLRRGQLSQRQASYLQQKIFVENLRRTILSDLSVAFNTLRRGVQSNAQRTVAVKQYQGVLRDETKRYRLGLATLLNVLQVEEGFTSAQFASIDAMNFVAKSLIELRHASGDIVPLGGTQIDLQQETLVTLPPQFARQD